MQNSQSTSDDELPGASPGPANVTNEVETRRMIQEAFGMGAHTGAPQCEGQGTDGCEDLTFTMEGEEYHDSGSSGRLRMPTCAQCAKLVGILTHFAVPRCLGKS